MKILYLLRYLLRYLLSLRVIGHFFIFGNMFLGMTDSSMFFLRFYHFDFQAFAMCFILLSIYVITYLKKSDIVPFHEKRLRRMFWILRVFFIFLLLSPTLSEVLSGGNVDNEELKREIFEVVKIFTIEFLLELFFYIIRVVKKKRKAHRLLSHPVA